MNLELFTYTDLHHGWTLSKNVKYFTRHLPQHFLEGIFLDSIFSEVDMGGERLILRGVIYLLLLVTFCLGLPSFHYTVALMIALLVRHKNVPTALFTPIDSYRLPTWGGQVRPLLALVRHTPKH